MANKASTCLVLTPKLMRDVADNQAMVALERHLIATMARRIRATNLAIQKAWKESIEEIVEEPQVRAAATLPQQLTTDKIGEVPQVRETANGVPQILVICC